MVLTNPWFVAEAIVLANKEKSSWANLTGTNLKRVRYISAIKTFLIKNDSFFVVVRSESLSFVH